MCVVEEQCTHQLLRIAAESKFLGDNTEQRQLLCTAALMNPVRNSLRQCTPRQYIELCQRGEQVNRMAHECCLAQEKIIHRSIGLLHAKELILPPDRLADALLEALARRNRRNIVKHHHAIVADMPEQNALAQRSRDIRMRQNDLLIAQDVAADNMILVLLRHRKHRKARLQQIQDDLPLIVAEILLLLLTVMRDGSLIRADQMVIKEEIIPKPEPKSLLFLIGCVLICVHISKIARVDHRCTANIELIRRAAEIFADLVQEIIELDVQLLHLDALILFDILDRKALDLLPFDAVRQTEAPRDIEHLAVCIQFTEIDVIVACLIEIGQKGVHSVEIILHMALQRTPIEMRLSIAKEKRQVINTDEQPRQRIITALNNKKKILDAVPVRAEILIAPPAPCRCTQIALNQRARDKDVRASMRRIETLDQSVDILHAALPPSCVSSK